MKHLFVIAQMRGDTIQTLLSPTTDLNAHNRAFAQLRAQTDTAADLFYLHGVIGMSDDLTQELQPLRLYQEGNLAFSCAFGVPPDTSSSPSDQ